MPASLSPSERSLLRIFPLPGVVLFPHAVMPLHVFEPRYKRLVEECLELELPFAPWGIDPRAEGSTGPGLFRVATAGRIRSNRRHADGRYDIIVEGVERVRLIEEIPMAAPYRAVRVEEHPLESCTRDEIASDVSVLHGIVGALAMNHPRAARLLQITLDRWKEPGELSDVLCTIAHDDPRLRQHLLETSQVRQRLGRVIETLGALLLRAPREEEGAAQ